MRERAGIFDLSAFAIFDVNGAGAARRAAARRRWPRWTSPVGRVVYTPLSSAPAAASSPTSRSCGSARQEFRIVTGGAHGMADRKLFVDDLPPDGSAQPGRRHDGVDDDRPLGAAGARHPR